MPRTSVTALILPLLGAALLALGCGGSEKTVDASQLRGIDRANFDTTCQPCRDFYQFANGGWKERNPIPPEYSDWTSWHVLLEQNLKIIREILQESVSADAPRGSIRQKIGDFYASAMDTARIESDGFKPLEKDLARIGAIASVGELRNVINGYHAEGLELLFDVDVFSDLQNSDIDAFYAFPGGLGLPDRDYYLRENEESEELRRKYTEHVANMFLLLGCDTIRAQHDAQEVMALETELAKATPTNVEMRNPETWYAVKTIDQANQLTPNFSWTAYFAALGAPETAQLSAGPDAFFARMDQLITETALDDWKNYLRWHLVHAIAPYLSSPFVNENFRFYGTTLSGIEELQPRWKRVQQPMNAYLGEALGQLYVERAFPPQAKARATELVSNLQAAFKERLTALDWMSAATKEKALAKLGTFSAMLGYPDKWRDYTALEIDRGPYADNVRRAAAFEIRRLVDKVGQPSDPKEWGMNAYTVNAYYNASVNQLVFPAGILQPPFFDAEADDALNYGGIGTVIGHEMLHGFDDQGSKFDQDGNMVNWWTDEDRAKFKDRSQPLIEQFNKYVVADSLPVNGELTLGENISDLGGLTVSYMALQKARAGKEDPMVDGLTQDQRFFLSWSQVWRANSRPESEKLQVQTDGHAPHRHRVNGPLSNMEEFARAWGCKEGDPMVRPDDNRIRIW